ncbi:MAG: hypothetical protein SNJ84_03685 [Verrucomicrobiia bacterium]
MIEVLLSVTVLMILTLFLTLVFNAMQATSSFWGRRIDAETQARRVLDRLGDDVARMVFRPDVDLALTLAPGDDAMRFFSQVEGHAAAGASGPSRGISVVEYRTNVKGQLERGARSLQFDQLVFAPLDREPSPDFPVALVDGPTNSVPPLENTYFDLLGDQILRFEIGFLLAGGASGQLPRLAAQLPAETKTKDILAVIVAVATLDTSARVPLSAEKIAALAAALPDYTEAHANAGQDILAVWSSILRNGDLTAIPGIPKTSAQSVRVFQRYYSLQ